MHLKIFKQALLIFTLHVAAGMAFAQFAWIDAKGVRQYSDQPPPASIPKGQILKQPAAASREEKNLLPTSDAAVATAPGTTGTNTTNATNATNATATAVTTTATTATATAPATTAEKNADYVKRRAEQAEKDKKAAEDAKNAVARAKNCELAQSYGRSLQSGERIASLDKNGERSFMSDEKRVQESTENRRTVETCK